MIAGDSGPRKIFFAAPLSQLGAEYLSKGIRSRREAQRFLYRDQAKGSDASRRGPDQLVTPIRHSMWRALANRLAAPRPFLTGVSPAAARLYLGSTAKPVPQAHQGSDARRRIIISTLRGTERFASRFSNRVAYQSNPCERRSPPSIDRQLGPRPPRPCVDPMLCGAASDSAGRSHDM